MGLAVRLEVAVGAASEWRVRLGHFPGRFHAALKEADSFAVPHLEIETMAVNSF
jgi:hypothetical protein